MEHRCHRRLPVALDVVLTFRDGPPLRGQLRNLGLGGMFVQVEEGSIPKQGALDVELSLEHEGTRHPFTMKAWVVHSGADGAGLMLRGIDQKDYYALRRFLTREQQALS